MLRRRNMNNTVYVWECIAKHIFLGPTAQVAPCRKFYDDILTKNALWGESTGHWEIRLTKGLVSLTLVVSLMLV